jgi:two-component system LytT family sensor kinase
VRDIGANGYPGIAALTVAWTAVGTIAFARHQVAGTASTPEFGQLASYVTYLACFLPWALLTGLVFVAERRFPLGAATWAASGLALGLISLPLVYAAWALTLAFGGLARWIFGMPPSTAGLTWLIPGHELLGHELLFVSSVAAAWMIRTLNDARSNERRAARLMLEKSQLETSLRQTELDALRMRLHPHFLFNSLQNIAVLTEHDPGTSRRMLSRLAELLRASLGRDNKPVTTLEKEVELTRAYLAIEQMRFGDRLSSLVDVAPDTRRAVVPTFLLQPIVENAIRHGLRHAGESGVIVIRSRRDADTLVLTVTDNGEGPPEAFSDLPLGIGLGATCERLARMYPGAHDFSMTAVPEGGTEVRIVLPFDLERTDGREDSRDFVTSAGRR